MTPGRSCPRHYRYTPDDIARSSPLEADCIYIVGGLYGNTAALDAIGGLAAHETVQPAIVFNGDFNWFNVDSAGFTAINSRVLAHTALRGNVETEIGSEDPAAGCGCGYPDFVGDAEVDRSNQIIERLRDTARTHPLLRSQLSALPMYATAAIGEARVAIVHGDCESLAGWGLSREALDIPAHQALVSDWFAQADADIIASSHSCLPVLMDFVTRDGVGVVVNNGAAGMPNFADTQYGVITRMGLAPSPHTPLYGTQAKGVHVDALAVRYESPRWRDEFHANWPPGSPAHTSYARRIAQGPAYRIDEACRLTGYGAPVRRPVAA